MSKMKLYGNVKDLSGMKFGSMSVISYGGIKNGHAMWICLCNCGKKKEVKGSNLLRGSTKSCGCLKIITNKNNKTKKWSPSILDESTLKIPLNHEKFALIDKEDFDRIKDYGWHFDKNNYARNRCGVMMHRIIMNCPENKVVYHKDHDGLNNRKNNLEINDKISEGQIKDISGMVFGEISVISLSHINERGLVVWNCLCSCGRQKKISGSDLRRGTISCGCMTGFHEKKWDPMIHDENTFKIPLSRGKYALIDKADLYLVKDIAWHYSGYARNRDGLLMHRVIVSCPENKEVDHINNNRIDNRRSNLRICTSHDNSMNRLMNFNNKVGYKGVYKKGNKYIARVKCNKKIYPLGSFSTAEEAYKIYCKKAKELHKEFFNRGI